MATGTTQRVSIPAFHADDPEQTTEYRKLSVLAIISLVFGLASPLAFAAPLLIAIPLFGIALGVLALRQIAVSGGMLAGSWAAMAGLMLCVVSAVAPFSRDFALGAIREHQAKEFGRNWIGLATSGELERAFRLTVDGARPQAPPEPGTPPPKTTPYQAFLDQPMITQLKATGANAEIRFRGTRAFEPQTFRNMVVRQLFTVSPASTAASATAASQPVEILLAIQRAKLPGEGQSRWLIVRCEDANAAAPLTPDH